MLTRRHTGYVPASYGHYVENTGNTTLRFLEVFKSDTFEDVSLGQVRPSPRGLQGVRADRCVRQWLALTPPELVKAHLQLSDAALGKLNTTKVVVAGPAQD